jgi:hypothetical protein
MTENPMIEIWYDMRYSATLVRHEGVTVKVADTVRFSDEKRKILQAIGDVETTPREVPYVKELWAVLLSAGEIINDS